MYIYIMLETKGCIYIQLYMHWPVTQQFIQYQVFLSNFFVQCVMLRKCVVFDSCYISFCDE